MVSHSVFRFCLYKDVDGKMRILITQLLRPAFQLHLSGFYSLSVGLNDRGTGKQYRNIL
jgi:hypothetical protein